MESLDEILSKPVAEVDVRVDDPRAPLQIIYTSGTTGDPKGVVMDNGRYGAFGSLGRALFGFTEEDRLYTGLSLTHGNAQAVTLANALAMEIPAVISRKFTRSRLWDICRKHGSTTFSLLGGMATAIYSQPEQPDDAENPVRFVTSAGMPAAIWEVPSSERFAVERSWSGTAPLRAGSPSSPPARGRWAPSARPGRAST